MPWQLGAPTYLHHMLILPWIWLSRFGFSKRKKMFPLKVGIIIFILQRKKEKLRKVNNLF